MSNLNPADVRAILRRLTAGETATALAAEYGVHRMTISRLSNGRTFRNVTGGRRTERAAPVRHKIVRMSDAGITGVHIAAVLGTNSKRVSSVRKAHSIAVHTTGKGLIMVPAPATFPSAFLDHVDLDAVDVETGCWIWTGATNPDGSGVWACRDGGGPRRVQRAHRWAWVFAHGRVPTGHAVFRRCASDLCVNPAHLYTEHHYRGMAARRADSGAMLGESNPSSILTADDVLEVRRRYTEDRVSTHTLAAETGMTESTVRAIIKGQTWRHVTGGADVARKNNEVFLAAPVPDYVMEARELYASGLSLVAVAARLNRSRDTVRRIVIGESWGHVTGGSNISRGNGRRPAR